MPCTSSRPATSPPEQAGSGQSRALYPANRSDWSQSQMPRAAERRETKFLGYCFAEKTRQTGRSRMRLPTGATRCRALEHIGDARLVGLTARDQLGVGDCTGRPDGQSGARSSGAGLSRPSTGALAGHTIGGHSGRELLRPPHFTRCEHRRELHRHRASHHREFHRRDASGRGADSSR